MSELLKKFGLNRKESATFLKLLELGGQPISVLAKQVGMARSSTYVVLEKLKKAGLIEEFPRMGIKYVKCVAIESLEDILLRKEEEIKNTLALLKQTLPALKAVENRLSITPSVKIYEGKDEIKKIYNDILKEKHFNAIFNPGLMKGIMPEYYFKIPENLKINKGTANELLVDCAEAREYKKKFSSKKHKIKIMPKKTEFYSDTIITDEKVFMISYGKNEIAAIEIFNKALAQSQNTMFNQMWNGL